MRTGQIITTALVVVLAAFVIACGDGQPDGKSQPAKNAGPQQAAPAQNPPTNPNVNQPGPVQGDPSAHDPDPQYIELHAVWRSETSRLPQIEYSIDGGGQIAAPGNAMHVDKTDRGDYLGSWVFETPARSGGRYGFTMVGTPSFTAATCEAVHHGQIYPGATTGHTCAVSVQIP